MALRSFRCALVTFRFKLDSFRCMVRFTIRTASAVDDPLIFAFPRSFFFASCFVEDAILGFESIDCCDFEGFVRCFKNIRFLNPGTLASETFCFKMPRKLWIFTRWNHVARNTGRQPDAFTLLVRFGPSFHARGTASTVPLKRRGSCQGSFSPSPQEGFPRDVEGDGGRATIVTIL